MRRLRTADDLYELLRAILTAAALTCGADPVGYRLGLR